MPEKRSKSLLETVPGPSSISSASICLSHEAGNSDFSLSSGSPRSMVQNRADGLSFDSYLLRTQTLPPTHVSCHCCFSILHSLTPISHENHVYFWKLSGEACLSVSTCHGSLSWPDQVQNRLPVSEDSGCRGRAFLATIAHQVGSIALPQRVCQIADIS